MVADGWAALPRECARLVERAFDDISLMAVDTAGRAPKRVHLIIKADRATHLAALRSPLERLLDQMRQRERELWAGFNGLAVSGDAKLNAQQLQRLEQQRIASDRLAVAWVEERVRHRMAGEIHHGSRFQLTTTLASALRQLCEARRADWEAVIAERLSHSGSLHSNHWGFARDIVKFGEEAAMPRYWTRSILVALVALVVVDLVLRFRFRRGTDYS